MLPVLIVLLAGCDEGRKSYPDADAEEEVVDVDEDGCWRAMDEAEPTSRVALHGTTGEEEDQHFWIYEAVIEGDTIWPPATIVQIEIWPERGGPSEPGVYDVVEGAYAECGLCVLVREGCTPDDGVARCARDHLATSGSVEIEELGEPGESLTGAVTDLLLVETDIDWDSGAFGSAPVEGGAVWCIGAMDVESVVSSYPVR